MLIPLLSCVCSAARLGNNPAGAKLCFLIRPESGCGSPSQFCLNGRCQMSYYGSDYVKPTCCPTRYV